VTVLSCADSIGVFDSGFGGLTVYKALREALPHENFIYLGDTARLPYGTKTPETVAQYALQTTTLLIEEGIKLLVVACNTASALALSALRQHLPTLPCIGVIEPGAEAAVNASATGRIAVLATESTVRSGAYTAAIQRRWPEANVHMLACNLLVSLVEEGWWDGPEAEVIVRRYLHELGVPGKDFDTLVLGCTHFPLLAPLIRRLIGSALPIIDSAVTTAVTVRRHLETEQTLDPQDAPGTSRFLVTDSPERFSILAARFVAGENFASGENVFHATLQPASPDKKYLKRL
jgi:glutamate racemase